MREPWFPETAMNNVAARVMARSTTFLLLIFLLLLSTSGCAGKSPVALSSPRRESIRHNERGIAAEAKGQSQQALAEFYESLRLDSSIDNTDGVVVALVNCTRVYRHSGDTKNALSSINRAIHLVTPDSQLCAEVSFEMAQVRLLTGELSAASEWALKSVLADTGVTHAMRINLLARILYLQGQLPDAERRVLEALSLAGNAAMRHEEANSYRILGDIQCAGKRYVTATESYNKALGIDKILGKSSKIAIDLRGLAMVAAAQNNLDLTLDMYKRAFTVSSSYGDLAGAAEILLEMARIHATRGEKELSTRLLNERDMLLKSRHGAP